jgi:hypothetical protein
MSTTDVIPQYPNKVVSKSEVTWCHSADSISRAYYGLETWARDHSYNALVGVRFMTCLNADGVIEFWAYGTAIA